MNINHGVTNDRASATGNILAMMHFVEIGDFRGATSDVSYLRVTKGVVENFVTRYGISLCKVEIL